jgi:hypothetical protein
MGRLAVLSYIHRAHSSATGCRCNTYEAKCAEELNLTYPLPNILEIRAMEEQESQGRPVCPPGPVVFHPGSTQDSLRKLEGNLSDYQVQTLRRCATMDPVREARHIVASVDPEWTLDITPSASQTEARDDTG